MGGAGGRAACAQGRRPLRQADVQRLGLAIASGVLALLPSARVAAARRCLAARLARSWGSTASLRPWHGQGRPCSCQRQQRLPGSEASVLEGGVLAAPDPQEACARDEAPQGARYAEFAEVLEEVGAQVGEGSRQRAKLALTEYSFVRVAKLGTEELTLAVRLALCQIHPGPLSGHGSQLKVGAALIRQAVQAVDPAAKAQAEELLESGGADDWGTAVEVVLRAAPRRARAPSEGLSLRQVRDRMLEISRVSGSKAVQCRVGLVVDLLRQVGPTEAKYLVRTLLGRGLRVRVAAQTVLEALADSVEPADPRETSAEVRARFALDADADSIVKALMLPRLSGKLASATAQLGTALSPMAAKPTRGVEDVLAHLDDGNTWTADWKYDGVRIQIHIGPDCEKVYSRNLKDVTQKYPEAIRMVKSCFRTGVTSAILDAEVVAVAQCGRLLPFQDLSKRPSVAPATCDGSTKSVHVFVFDCMLLNGESLLDQALADRRTRLADALQFEDGHPLKPATSRQFSSEAELEEALSASIADATEGLIAKRLSAAYEPGKRSNHWLKLKKDYLQETR
ncbi:unnamed protein product [Prorocentrum cordatum]|uniref:ATP-dependent DNA ligase family profile domain-containing protein n=1 Tax=Prorocentrum cordatum TaxID=2364126 RepID=A0ABN9TFB3_9DINO|nr:unnamed protein product [Polarella glacialis]